MSETGSKGGLNGRYTVLVSTGSAILMLVLAQWISGIGEDRKADRVKLERLERELRALANLEGNSVISERIGALRKDGKDEDDRISAKLAETDILLRSLHKTVDDKLATFRQQIDRQETKP